MPKNNLPISQMITKINESVMPQGVQIADPLFRMKREVFFLPKNVSENCIYIEISKTKYITPYDLLVNNRKP